MKSILAPVAFAFAVAACATNPSTPNQFPANPPPNPVGEPPNSAVGPEAAGAPMYPVAPEKPHVAHDPGPTVVGNAPASPPPPPIVTDELPIDPDKPMPARSVGTDAALAGVEQPARVLVDARADIASAGLVHAADVPGGVLPTRVALVNGGGAVRIRDVRGKTASGDLLVGVFLDEKGTRGKVPPTAAAIADEAAGVRPNDVSVPRLGETFLIGDGLARTGTGALQTFAIPRGATRLYLGYSARSYADHSGGVSAIVTQHAR